jgi:CheY-like chemotaxis protein
MNHRVLLIEDNEQNRYLATFLLEQRGHTVVSASDGPKGIEIAQSLLPGIILLDIQLPGMDGYAVARALRALDSLREVSIIAVTSYAMAGDREKALAAGCNGYIEKPINPETFVDQIMSFHCSVPAKKTPIADLERPDLRPPG